MERKMISIIVPMYNCEKNINECINSILEQTYLNFEILLINDGSNDKTLEICKKFKLKDCRIKIFSQTNSGPSSARNYGIEKSNGKYIMFIDSDDVLDKYMLEKMLHRIEKDKTDLIISNYYYWYENNRKNNVIFDNKDSVYYQKDMFLKISELSYTERFNPLWNKLYKYEIIKKYNIKFDNDLRCGEDLKFNIDYLEKCLSFSTISEFLYYYRISDSYSLSKEMDLDKWKKEKYLIDYYINLFKKENLYEDNKEKINAIYFLKFKETCDLVLKSNMNLKSKNEYIKNIITDKDMQLNIKNINVYSKFDKLIYYFLKNKLHTMIIGVYCCKRILYKKFKKIFFILKKGE